MSWCRRAGAREEETWPRLTVAAPSATRATPAPLPSMSITACSITIVNRRDSSTTTPPAVSLFMCSTWTRMCPGEAFQRAEQLGPRRAGPRCSRNWANHCSPQNLKRLPAPPACAAVSTSSSPRRRSAAGAAGAGTLVALRRGVSASGLVSHFIASNSDPLSQRPVPGAARPGGQRRRLSSWRRRRNFASLSRRPSGPRHLLAKQNVVGFVDKGRSRAPEGAAETGRRPRVTAGRSAHRRGTDRAGRHPHHLPHPHAGGARHHPQRPGVHLRPASPCTPRTGR